MFNNIYRIAAVMVALALLVSAAAGAVVVQNVEIRGSVADGNETYDYANFAGFWLDLNKNLSSEVMTIALTGNRTIDEGNVVYTCTKKHVDYKNDDLQTKYGGYDILGFMARKYLCHDNRTDELCEILIEWSDSDDMVLSTGEAMNLPQEYKLVAEQIDLQGDKVWLKLYKNGECVDDSIVDGGALYTYEDEDDVLVLGMTVESVFRGTESNLVVVNGVFLRSEDILDVDGGETFGVMEVTSTSSTAIILKNDETLTLDKDSEVDVMGDLYFKVADSDTLRYYLAKTVSLTCPECPECPVVEPCPEVETTNDTVVETADVTPPEIVEAIPDAEPEDKPTAVPTKKTTPGFEAVFALVGLLAVAALVLRQRK